MINSFVELRCDTFPSVVEPLLQVADVALQTGVLHISICSCITSIKIRYSNRPG